MKSLTLVLAVLALTGCTALGIGSPLDKEAAAANVANVKALVAENTAYTNADATLPASLKATRAARNDGAVKVAEDLTR